MEKKKIRLLYASETFLLTDISLLLVFFTYWIISTGKVWKHVGFLPAKEQKETSDKYELLVEFCREQTTLF